MSPDNPVAHLKREDTVHGGPGTTRAWDRVQLARHPARPYTLDYLRLAFMDFTELHGDRLFAEDPAIVSGLATLEGFGTVMAIGHQKGRDTKENIHRRFGMARPEGFRKALRLMKHAEKFALPVVTFIDIPGADPTLPAEERGQAFAIAENILAMTTLRVPIVATIIGEGGSGGAIALGVADRLLMLENSIYSVASPEAAASILWRDGARGPDAAQAMRITAQDMLELGIADTIIPEPPGGAHEDHAAVAVVLRDVLRTTLDHLQGLSVDRLVGERAERYRAMGEFIEA